MSLWRGEPLVLASKSEVRRNLFEAAQIPVTIDPANIDEREIEARHTGLSPEEASLLLAREKALVVARRRKGLILGADQTLALGEHRFSKPANVSAAR
jgi:septum formation protein